MSSRRVKSRTWSWEAQEGDQQFGVNEGIGIGNSQGL